ncbi:hypothetical protein [Streptomyces nogalater]|uniref:Uncharacterized protein n=1 Tax=Streptomyces nogalater TaxID=38314 RepID=A0ABW0WCI8_STRNO
MQNFKQQILEEAVLTVLSAQVADTLKKHRVGTQTTLEDFDLEKVAVRLPNGIKVASISAVNPDPKPEVDDEDAFTEFVAEHAPDEVITRTVIVTEVRPAYREQLLQAMAKRGAAEVVSSDGGEILEVPGVVMKEGTRTHSVRFEGGDAGRKAVAAAWAAGELRHLTGLRALTAGDADSGQGGAEQ